MRAFSEKLKVKFWLTLFSRKMIESEQEKYELRTVIATNVFDNNHEPWPFARGRI